MSTCPKCNGAGKFTGTQESTGSSWAITCSHCLGSGTDAPLFKYAGFGARETPMEIIRFMEAFAMSAAVKGCVLRSGRGKRKIPAAPDTDSADLAFERGCDLVQGRKVIRTPTGSERAQAHAAQHHPAWNSCSDFAKSAHARNSQIILGDWLDDPVQFGICWTPGGATVGGTGQGIRVAIAHMIPIYNLAIPSHFAAMQEWTK